MHELRWKYKDYEYIHHKNTGNNAIYNLNKKETETKINSLIKEAGRYYYKSKKNKQILYRYSKYTYLAYKQDSIKNNNTIYSDNEIKVFLADYNKRFKMPLKQLLLHYFRMEFNPDLFFKGSFLESLGFKKCEFCYN
mgnify:CR=1 FL=1